MNCSKMNQKEKTKGKGMGVADKIVNTPRDARDNPIDRVEMKSVKIVNR